MEKFTKEIKKHNPDYRLVGQTFYDDGKYIDLVYGVSNEGENEGLEAYYKKEKTGHFYRSYRWESDKIPSKFQDKFEYLKENLSLVPPGSKLTINNGRTY